MGPEVSPGPYIKVRTWYKQNNDCDKGNSERQVREMRKTLHYFWNPAWRKWEATCKLDVRKSHDHICTSVKAMANLDNILKSRDITLPTKVCLVKAMFFSSSHVWMWELDHREDWEWKNWCFWTVVLEKTLESPLDCQEIQPVHPKGDQPWMVIGRTDVEAETPILWPPDAKSWLIWKDPDAGKDWGQEKGTTKDEMVGWHHWLNGYEFG